MSKDQTIQFPNPMSLRLAAVYVDVSEQRLRILVREGKIVATQDERGQWWITRETLDAYVASKKLGAPRTSRSGRTTNGKAWIIKVKAENYDAVVAALEPFGIELEPRYNYAKQKAYQAKRRAAKKAAEAESLVADIEA